MDLTPKEIMSFLGHDGSEIIWPDQPEPLRRRAFHWEEFTDLLIKNLMIPVFLPADVSYGPDSLSKTFEPFDGVERIEYYLALRPGVLLVETMNGKRHAVAWCHKEKKCFDPEGFKGEINDYKIGAFIALF